MKRRQILFWARQNFSDEGVITPEPLADGLARAIAKNFNMNERTQQGESPMDFQANEPAAQASPIGLPVADRGGLAE